MGRRILIGLIRFYRAAVSPLLPASCRYIPTCSEYAEAAVGRHGALRGGWMALRRLLRCRPFGGRGYDPVPGTSVEEVARGPAGERSAHGSGRHATERERRSQGSDPDG